MTDLISRSAVINVLQELADMETCGNTVSDIGFGLSMAIGRLISAPAIDAVPVVHARWIGFPNGGVWGLKCDACHRIIPMGQTPETMHYCPQCGARMDGEENVVD